MQETLTEREKKILCLTVYYHIDTGEPVGSRYLSKKLDLDLSPATVRNVMADLEERGLLRQTHPSSGRIPTDRGYRCYVDLIGESRRRLQPEYAQRINDYFSRGRGGVQEVIRETSHTLSELSSQLGLVVAPRFADSRFEHLEFLRLGRARILAIFVSESGLIQNRIFDLEEDLSQDDLQAMAKVWNERFASRPVREVRRELLELLERDRAEFDRIIRTAFELGSRVLCETGAHDGLYTDGAANILGWPDFSDPQKLRSLIRAVEEKTRLLEVLDKSQRADGVQIIIGAEISLPEFHGVSIVTAPYRRGDEPLGIIGIIGPTRMEYARIIPIVEYTAGSLSEYLSCS